MIESGSVIVAPGVRIDYAPVPHGDGTTGFITITLIPQTAADPRPKVYSLEYKQTVISMEFVLVPQKTEGGA